MISPSGKSRHYSEKEAQYRSIFEATYDGMAIYDLDGFFVEVNPAICRMSGYTRDEHIGVHSSSSFLQRTSPMLHMCWSQSRLAKSIKHGQNVCAKMGHCSMQKHMAPPLPIEESLMVWVILRDTSEQVQAKKLLEQRVEERTRELASLLEISHTVASTLQLKPLLGLILDQLKPVVDYTGSAILTVEGENLIILDNRSPIQEEQLMQLRFPLEILSQSGRQSLHARQSLCRTCERIRLWPRPFV